MNAEPHTHELQIEKFGSSSLKITYGDTSDLLLPSEFRTARQLRRKIRALKRQHDKGSTKGQQRADLVAQVLEQSRAELAQRGWEG